MDPNPTLLFDDQPAKTPDGKVLSSREVGFANSVLDSKLQTSSAKASPPEISVPSYAQRFKSSLRNLRKISSPTFLEDGTPVVQAPASVLLSTAEIWKDHIVAHFHGSCPPPGKIFADLNPVWGKFGDITVRMVSETSCLIFVPNVQSREWVLQVGYWQVDHCAVSVFPWSAEGSLHDLELKFAPTWVILKNVPPQLYSLDGISVIASAVGEPLHTEKSRLDPYHFGDTKVKIEIDLSMTPPTLVEVRDSEDNSVRIKLEYPKLPPKCCNCGKFGHLMNRCPKPLMKKKMQHQTQEKERIKVAMAPQSVSVANAGAPVFLQEAEVKKVSEERQVEISAVSRNTQRRARSRSRARARRRSLSQLPSYHVHSEDSDDDLGGLSRNAGGSSVTVMAKQKSVVAGVKDHETQSNTIQEIEDFTYSETPVEEHIWLLPKAARRARKKEQKALWNASAGQMLKNRIPQFLNRGDTSGRKRNL